MLKPGETLRKLRAARGLTLDEVSGKTGLAASTLSKIENNKMSLTFDKLQRISNGLNIDISELFKNGAPEPGGTEGPRGRRSVTRAGEGELIESQNYLHRYAATDLLKKQFVPIIADVMARSIEDFGEMVNHPGEEYSLVLEGEIELHTKYYAPLRLGVGDSVYFDSGMDHAYIAVGEGRCRMLCICTPSDHPGLVDMASP
ncbi:XRE family transcriptional regulator [Sphingosinicella ginsenosidimutans]|nr:XRE family transcriptional regulator [Sphingosinicella ginsenosidimutans]